MAEQLILDDISTGASNDLERATQTARAMVTRYGFSDRLGPVVYGTDQNQTFLGRDLGQGRGYSEEVASEIDHEIRDIVDEAYEAARRILTEHLPELHKLAAALIEREKLSGEEFRTIMEGGELPPLEENKPAEENPAEPSAPEAPAQQPAESAEAAQNAESAEAAEPAENAQPAESEPGEQAQPENKEQGE